MDKGAASLLEQPTEHPVLGPGQSFAAKQRSIGKIWFLKSGRNGKTDF